MRLTNISFCSACFTQDPNKRHVDLDAACDRGFTYGDGGRVQMDDLILCEECLREAARLIGMQTAERVTEQEIAVKDAFIERERAQKERDQAQNYADRLEDAIDSRPKPIKTDHRKKPRSTRSEVAA